MKWIYRFFVVLGVLFFCLLLGLGYFIVADPFNLRPLFSSMYEMSTSVPERENAKEESITTTNDTNNDEQSNASSNLSAQQSQALKAVGIDSSSVPNQFTPKQTDCFVTVLGQGRVDAIKAGATPTPTEFFQAKDCL